jgi:hypothetical protein
MPSHDNYVPVLKWKMGEYQALSKLSDSVKNKITPLIEIPPVGFDFELSQNRESWESHLGDFGKRLKSKWQSRPCFVDLKWVPDAVRVGSQHPVDFVLGQARAEGCTAIPVVPLSSDRATRQSIRRVVREDGRGVALRISRSDFDSDSISIDIEACLTAVDTPLNETDLVIDMGMPNYVPLKIFVRSLSTVLYELLPTPNRWRSLVIVGSSYPASVVGLESEFVTRYEWLAYKAFIQSLSPGSRIPTYGDYGAATTDLVELDMRLIKPMAKLRYTTDDKWYIAVGKNVRAHGFEQYRAMCDKLRKKPFFSGRGFSEADRYIEDCAKGVEKTGNLSTWVWVATNRHVSKVVFDLATLYAS